MQRLPVGPARPVAAVPVPLGRHSGSLPLAGLSVGGPAGAGPAARASRLPGTVSAVLDISGDGALMGVSVELSGQVRCPRRAGRR